MRFLHVSVDRYERAAVADEFNDLKQKLIIPFQDNFAGTLVNLAGTQNLDDMAQAIYGPGSEPRWYVIANRNVREIVGWKCDFDNRIRQLFIPNETAYD